MHIDPQPPSNVQALAEALIHTLAEHCDAHPTTGQDLINAAASLLVSVVHHLSDQLTEPRARELFVQAVALEVTELSRLIRTAALPVPSPRLPMSPYIH